MEELTKSILDLLLARQKLAELIAEVKQSSGVKVENQAVEQKLESEMTKYAARSGLDKELARKVVTDLIEHSKMTQRRKIFLASITNFLRDSGIRKVSVFGAGRMGRWFVSYFLQADTSVLVYDQNRMLTRKWKNHGGLKFARSLDQAAKSDLLVVAVPIRETPKLIRSLVEISAGHRVRILEISSVKSQLNDLISKDALPENVKLYSIHPLFGPITDPFAENTIIQVGKSSDFVERLFPHYKVLSMSIQDHDRLMVKLLTLPHLHALTFADTIKSGGNPIGIRSASFDYMLEFARRVLGESERIYFEIQATNPYSSKAFLDTVKSVRKLQSLIGSEASFEKFFKKTRNALG